MSETLHARVTELLAQVQPVLGLHGGALELVGITPDNVVEIRFKGACVGCAAADITLEYGLKEMLMIKCEEITDVVAVNDEPVTHAAPQIPLNYAQHS
jgi:Fe-S cluster biogenesis protein NfuA